MPAADHINPDESLWHWLAYDLRRYRVARGETVTAVARIMETSREAVSSMEAMRRSPNKHHLRRIDDAWQTGKHFSRILNFARRNHDTNWFTEHLIYEERADTIKTFEPLVVPGLLQTEDYARVTIGTEGSSDVDRAVKIRLARQERLTRAKPPRLYVLLDECVIDRPVGGPEVMRAQLARLLEFSRLPNVTLRVVRRGTGYHLGLRGAFKIMTVRPEGDVAYTEASEGGRLELDSAAVRRAVLRFDEIGADALNRAESRNLLERVRESMT